MVALECRQPHVSRRTDRKSTRLNSSHTVIYTLSLHDALPIWTHWLPCSVTARRSSNRSASVDGRAGMPTAARLQANRSEEHTSELQSHSDLHSFPTRRSSDLDALVALLSDGAPVEQSVCQRRWSRWNADSRTSPGEQAASALVAIGHRSVTPLMRALKSSSWIARRNAAWALGALDDRRAGAPLIELLADPEPGVREQAAWALGALDEPAAVSALVTALKDQSPKVRAQAAWALGAIDDRRAVDALVQALSDNEGGVRAQVSWALGAIGDSRAVNALLPALKDPDAGVRRQAAWAIGVLSR